MDDAGVNHCLSPGLKQVRQLEDVHPEFDPKLLAYFVGEIAKPLATMVGQVKIMYRGDRILHAAEEVMEVGLASSSG